MGLCSHRPLRPPAFLLALFVFQSVSRCRSCSISHRPLRPLPYVRQGTQNTVVFRASAPGQTVRGSVVRANFVTSPGFAQPGRQAASLLLRGVPPRLEGTEVVFQVGWGGSLPFLSSLLSGENNLVWSKGTEVVFQVGRAGKTSSEKNSLVWSSLRARRWCSRWAGRGNNSL